MSKVLERHRFFTREALEGFKEKITLGSSPLNYKDDDGYYREIDTKISEDSVLGRFINGTNALKLNLSYNATDPNNLEFKTDEGHSIVFDLEDMRYTNGEEVEIVSEVLSNSSYVFTNRDGDNGILQADVFPQVSDEYTVRKGLVKHDIRLVKKPVAPTIEGDVYLEFFYKMRIEEDFEIIVEDEEITDELITNKDIKIRFNDGESITLVSPYFIDSAGINGEVFYKVLKLDEDNMKFSFRVKYSDLEDLTYPVIIDPTSRLTYDSLNDDRFREYFTIPYDQTISWKAYLWGGRIGTPSGTSDAYDLYRINRDTHGDGADILEQVSGKGQDNEYKTHTGTLNLDAGDYFHWFTYTNQRGENSYAEITYETAPQQIKRHTGSSWATVSHGNIKRYTGSSWSEVNAVYRYTGSGWDRVY